MKKTKLTKCLSVFSVCVLFAAVLMLNGCGKEQNEAAILTEDVSELGEGETSFELQVIDGEGNELDCQINTNETTVGDALLELGLISGEDNETGLYVESVNGIAADYEEDGTYWAFYIDGEYADTGVSETEITPSSTYTLKLEIE